MATPISVIWHPSQEEDLLRIAEWAMCRLIVDYNKSRNFDILRPVTDTALMVEKDIHIVARSAGIPMAGCRDDDHAN